MIKYWNFSFECDFKIFVHRKQEIYEFVESQAWWVDILKHEQNVCLLANNISKCIFLKEQVLSVFKSFWYLFNIRLSKELLPNGWQAFTRPDDESVP